MWAGGDGADRSPGPSFVCYGTRVQWTPEALARDAQGTLKKRGQRETIVGAFIDSRAPRPGGLFVPIVAARDGHDFIESAIEGGAAAVLIERGRPVPVADVTVVEVEDTLAALTRLGRAARARCTGPVITVTGSNGKTTTRSMIEEIVRRAFPEVLATRGNLNNHLGVPLTLLDEPHQPQAMVLELGMNAPGENAALADIARPTIAVITSVALEHLEFMGTIEAIAAAEAEPIAALSPEGVVVVPSDEPLLTPHLPGPEGPRVVTFGPDAGATVRITSVVQGERTVARFEIEGTEIEARLDLFGGHNARNAAAALAVGRCLGVDARTMVEALESVKPVGDRSRVIPWGPHLLVSDCYNANPGSVEMALQGLAALRATRSGPLFLVLGDMLELGPTEDELHAAVGTLAGRLGIDGVVGFGPRSEATVRAALDAGLEAAHVDSIEAARAWVVARLEHAEPGAVLVKGSRGMKLERLVEALQAAVPQG